MDGQRLHAEPRGDARHGGDARRSLRPSVAYGVWHRAVHAVVGRLCGRAHRRLVDRRAHGAGHRRGVHVRADRRAGRCGLPRRASWCGARDPPGPHRPRDGRRAGHRRGDLTRARLALRVLGQRSARCRRGAADPDPDPREPGRRGTPRPARRRARDGRTRRRRVGARARQRRGLGKRRESSARSRPARCCCRRSWRGSAARRRRCCRCGCIDRGRSQPGTSRASPCSGRCSRPCTSSLSSCSPGSATRRCRPGCGCCRGR